MKIEIKKIGINGEGIGYFKGKPVFVEGALINEVVECKIGIEYDTYIKASLINIEKTSLLRCDVNCKSYKDCGACSLLHTTYKNQLEIKKQLVKEAFLKYSKTKIDLEINPSPKQFNYRNSLKLPFCKIDNKIKCGLYKTGTNHIFEVDNCLNHDELIESVKDYILDVLNKYNFDIYDSKSKKGLRYLYLRNLSKRIQMCIITGNDQISQNVINDLSLNKYIISIYQNISLKKGDIFGSKMIHLYGQKHLNFKYDDLKLKISLKSFYQLNTLQAKKLYLKVQELIPKDKNLLVEAYCGIGVMSLMCFKYFKKVIGVECINEAVINARTIAKLNNITNVEFIHDDFKYMFKNFKEKIDVLIVDPPRTGLDNEVISTILKNDIDEIIYISCNPSTLAKNFNQLKTKYKIKHIEAFDMFANTSHVETLVLLKKKH